MSLDRDLLLARSWERPGRTVWLAVDLLGGDRILELKSPDLTPKDSPGAIVVFGSGSECRALDCGGLLVTEDILWSLLDPRGAAHAGPGFVGEERVAVEADLRTAARKFHERLVWWRRLDDDLVRSRKIARLRAKPWAKYCIEYARKVEQGLVRPGEDDDEDEDYGL